MPVRAHGLVSEKFSLVKLQSFVKNFDFPKENVPAQIVRRGENPNRFSGAGRSAIRCHFKIRVAGRG